MLFFLSQLVGSPLARYFLGLADERLSRQTTSQIDECRRGWNGLMSNCAGVPVNSGQCLLESHRFSRVFLAQLPLLLYFSPYQTKASSIMVYNILAGAGIVLLLLSVSLFQKSMKFLRTSARATAVVVDIITVYNSKGNTYKPVFSFETASREKITWTRDVSTSPAGWAIGEQTVLAYDPANPNKVALLTYFGVFRWGIILLCIAMPPLVIGGGYFLTKSLLH